MFLLSGQAPRENREAETETPELDNSMNNWPAPQTGPDALPKHDL